MMMQDGEGGGMQEEKEDQEADEEDVEVDKEEAWKREGWRGRRLT